MELLESSVVRPRQARYQAALRPDSRNVSTRNSRGSDRLVLGVAQPFEVAIEAFWLACLADASSVPDQLVRKENPPVRGNNLHQVLLDFLWVRIPRQIQPLRKPLHVRVHNHAGRDAKRR